MQRGDVSGLLTDAAASDIASIYRDELKEAGLDAADSVYAQLRTAIERIGAFPESARLAITFDPATGSQSSGPGWSGIAGFRRTAGRL